MPDIPRIADYPLPSRNGLPDNTVDWTLDPDRAALLVHDMQHFFLRPFGAAPELRKNLVEHCALLREACVDHGVPVAYTAQPGGMSPEQRGLLKDFWGAGMTASPEDRDIIDELSPGPRDLVVTKWRYSAFHRSDLLGWLASQGRDQLIVCGVYAHVGVMMTVVDAFSHDVQVFLPADGIADFTPEYHELALDYTAARCGSVTTTNSLLASLGSGRSGLAARREARG
ncbi:phenazine biosynthesis protein PhzD [Nocardiopsis kunsanensis]|uniref:Phenazine biosynthesis protein PhzD n=1 Tax=Nocardiopsis kunsanensis TaxID=141693 RepID=A0A919CG65_9ACTN|nr:isochorismatase family protein [Nocardiopsis kunsanensis]GHD17664.1 phenazine biosynthesis protein PhzD [Nocardiopsis kunsanensis]